jgi:hypothetical protein
LKPSIAPQLTYREVPSEEDSFLSACLGAASRSWERRLERSSDPHIRALGVQHALQREPRLWMLPRDIYQQELLLRAIARLDGARAVEALISAPSVLDHYTDHELAGSVKP